MCRPGLSLRRPFASLRRLRLGRAGAPIAQPVLRAGASSVRVMGIDPGTRRVGYAILEREPGRPLRALAYGVIHPRADAPIAVRLLHIQEELRRLIRRWKPDAAALESAFYGKSIPAALRIGEGRGAALVAASGEGVPVSSYAPAEVKKAVVGNGAAHKRQVQAMACSLLSLGKARLPLDASDALAIALCHAHRAP